MGYPPGPHRTFVVLIGQAGCVGHDDESDGVGKSGGHLGELRAIEFPRIKGGKPFDKAIDWFQAMLGAMRRGPHRHSSSPHSVLYGGAL
jgi:hypothetical protein